MNDSQNIPPESLGDFLLRLTVTSVLLAAVLKIFQALVVIIMTWGASSFLTVISSKYYLESLSAVGNGFIVKSWGSPNEYGFELHSLMLGFGLPISFALALPGALSRGYWVRLLTTILASYFVSVFVVALVADRALIENFGNLGLQLQPAWRSAFSSAVVAQLWAFTTVGFPLFVIMMLAPASGQLSPELAKYFGGVRRGQPSLLLAILVATLMLCVAYQPVLEAQWQEVRETPSKLYFDDFAVLNPDHFGENLVDLAQSLERRKDFEAAVNVYQAANRYLEGKALAESRRALRKLVDKRRRSRPGSKSDRAREAKAEAGF